jgi:glycosyltransferase involved in cell wall biosynthesis
MRASIREEAWVEQLVRPGRSERTDTAPAPRPSLSMLGWAWNEEESIAEYIDRAERFLRTLTDDFELVIIDDGSADGTAEVVRRYQGSRPWLRLHRNDSNRGSGYNTKVAIALARKDYLFWQMVDWSYDLSRLGDYLPHLGRDCDVLQGVRQGTTSLRGVLRKRSDTAYKGLVSIINYLLVRTLFQLPVHDYQNVTVYPTRLIQSVTLESESAFTNPECLLKIWWTGATIREFPVPFLKRTKGVGKGTRPRVVLRSTTDILRWWFRWVVLDRRSDKGNSRVIPVHAP